MRPTLQAILTLWRQRGAELGQVSKETCDLLDSLIRDDEREKCIREIELLRGASDPKSAATFTFIIGMLRSPAK